MLAAEPSLSSPVASEVPQAPPVASYEAPQVPSAVGEPPLKKVRRSARLAPSCKQA